MLINSETSTNTATSSDSNPMVKITNNLSYNIDIYDVYNPSKDGTTLPYKYTKLDTIAAGASKSIQTIREASMLQAMYTGSMSKINNFYFYQFPIKVMSAIQFSFENPPPLEFTVASIDEDAMTQSFLFHRFAMANPESALTKNLYAALKKGSVDSVNSFFAGTKNFKSCTLSSWNAVMSWLQMFTSGWQGPYYLYEQAPNPSPKDYTPVLVATLNIESSATANSATLSMCSADANGNPIYATPSQTTTIIMNGDGTMGDENPGEDVSTSLTPVWMNVIQTTMKNGAPVSNYLVGPTVTGTIVDKKVVSSQTARQMPGKPADKNKASSFDASFGKICQGVGLLVGLLMLGEFAGKMGKSAKDKLSKLKEDSTSKEDFDNGKKTVDSTPDPEVVSEATAKEATFTQDAKDVGESYGDTSKSLQENVMKETMEDTSAKIQEKIQTEIEDGYTPTEKFENAVTDMEKSFEDAKTKIDNGDLTDASKELSDASEKIDATIKESGDSMDEWESSSLEESSTTVKDAADETDALDTAEQDRTEDIDNSSEDSGYNETEDKEWPTSEEL